MKVFGSIVALLAIFILGPIWSGYILSLLWAWFMVPVFHFPQLTIPLAIGIGYVIRFMTWQMPLEQDSKKSDSENALIRIMTWSFLYPLFVLGFAYIVHLFT